MNPLRKRFTGDSTTAQRYTGEAMGLLDAVHDQMRLGGNDQLQMHKVLGNGVELFAASRFGQDEIRVHVTPRPRAVGGRESVYCVWEDDRELFSEPYVGMLVTGPATANGVDVFLGGAISHNLGDDTYLKTVRQYKAEDLSIVGDTDPNYIPGDPIAGANTIPRTLYADRKTNRVYMYGNGNTNFAGGDAIFGAVPGGGSAGVRNLVSTESFATTLATNAESGFGPRYFPNDAGDMYVTMRTSGGSSPPSFIRRIAINSGANETVTLPEEVNALGDKEDLILTIPGSNDVWLGYAASTFDGFVYSYTGRRLFHYSNGTWVEKTPPNGYGNFDARVNFNTVNTETRGEPLMHDPITGAVCMVMSDLSGAWIYNGKDCFGQPMGDFFRKFNALPPGFSVSGHEANMVHCRQFYNGRIYIAFHTFVAPEDPYQYSVAIGSYKVGRLLQKKQTNVE